jgi:hypothetical protein
MTCRRILPLITVALLCLLTAPPAGARYRVGIGDQSASIFSTPRFTALGIKRVRYLVPWDWRRVAGQTAEVDGYLKAARAAGKEVFVTFTASRGCFSDGRYSRAVRCRAPSSKAYSRSFRAFRSRFRFVRVFAPWNEANHVSQPTRRSPARAASYYNVVRRHCRGCTIVAADVLDQSGVDRYLRAFLRRAAGSPRRFGLHNYSDVNRRRPTGTRRVLRTVPGEVWLTETGGVVSFGRDFPYSESRAASRTRYMFRLADTYTRRRSGMRSRITRIYPYSFTGVARGARFDAGLTDPDGSPRSAYSVFRAYVRRRAR